MMKNFLKDKRAFIDIGDVHPFAVVFAVIGGLIGWYMVKVATGTGGFAVGDATLHLGFIWKLLIPISCAAAGFFVANKMFE